MIQQNTKTRKAMQRAWDKRALQRQRAHGGGFGGARQIEFAVLAGEQQVPASALTCDLLEAYRWLHHGGSDGRSDGRSDGGSDGPQHGPQHGPQQERVHDRVHGPQQDRIPDSATAGSVGGSGPQGNTLEELWIGWRRGPAQPWRKHGPLLSLPEPALEGGRLDPAPLVATPLAASPRAARARLRMLLRRGGLDAPAAASLLCRYEGYFPNIEVATAQILQARLGGDLRWLRWLDLRAMLWDLIAAAALWTLPDRGERGWPAGLHIFAS